MSQDDRIIDHDLVRPDANRRTILFECCGAIKVEPPVEGVLKEPDPRYAGQKRPRKLSAFSVVQVTRHHDIENNDACDDQKR